MNKYEINIHHNGTNWVTELRTQRDQSYDGNYTVYGDLMVSRHSDTFDTAVILATELMESQRRCDEYHAKPISGYIYQCQSCGEEWDSREMKVAQAVDLALLVCPKCDGINVVFGTLRGDPKKDPPAKRTVADDHSAMSTPHDLGDEPDEPIDPNQAFADMLGETFKDMFAPYREQRAKDDPDYVDPWADDNEEE